MLHVVEGESLLHTIPTPKTAKLPKFHSVHLIHEAATVDTCFRIEQFVKEVATANIAGSNCSYVHVLSPEYHLYSRCGAVRVVIVTILNVKRYPFIRLFVVSVSKTYKDSDR